MFTINQLNNRQNTSPEDISLLSSLLEVIAGSFKGPMTTNDFIIAERYRYLNQDKGAQLFYITNDDKDNELVTLFIFYAREGNLPDSRNIGVSLVSTNPEYRKQGWVSKLMHWAIAYYETGVSTIEDTNIHIAESISNGTSQQYIDAEIPSHIRESENINWTLYSIVDQFYARFGFHADPLTSWLTIQSTDVAGKFESFELDPARESAISVKEMDAYFTESKYNLDENLDNESYNCAFSASSAREFCEISIDYYIQNKHNIDDADALAEYFSKNTGIHITDHETGEETVVILSPFFLPSIILVSKVFTSAQTEEKFLAHWSRALQYIYTYCNKVWSSTPSTERARPSDFSVAFIDADFVCKTGSVSRDRLKQIVVEQNGWKNHHPHMLPMIRIWGHPERAAHIAHNGMWCIM